MASKCNISTKTVEQYKRIIRQKLGCRTDYGIPGAVARIGLSASYLRGYRKSTNWNTGYLRLSSWEVQFVQHLIYDLNIQDVLKLDKFATLSQNITLTGVCEKAETKHYFELVAILLHHGLVKVPVTVRLNSKKRIAS